MSGISCAEQSLRRARCGAFACGLRQQSGRSTAGECGLAPGGARQRSRTSSSMSATACSSRPTRPSSRRSRIATLDKQAQWLGRYNRYAFTVEGHADERGTREYNIALGARRAQTVRDYLISRGVEPNRMRTISYGKERPVAVCNDISCWSQNRRASRCSTARVHKRSSDFVPGQNSSRHRGNSAAARLRQVTISTQRHLC